MATDLATVTAVPKPVRWSPEQFQRMSVAGLLPEAPGHELIAGTIYQTSPLNPPRTTAVLQLEAELRDLLPPGYHVRTQQPLIVGESAPEPDLAVVRGNIRDFASSHPTSEHVVLVVEVADASLQFDCTTKLELYAAAEVPTYWIVNLRDRRIEVHENAHRSDDGAAEYTSRSFVAGEERLPVRIDDRDVGSVEPNAVIA